MRLNRRYIIPIVILVLLLSGGLWWWRSRAVAASAINATGTIEATEFVVSSELAGRVSEVTVGEGDPVSAGQVVVQMDSALLQAQRDQAQAAAVAAQHTADVAAINAGLEQRRVTPLQDTIAAAQAQADAAQAQADAARAAVTALDVQLEKMTLTAPITGTVLERSIEPGETALPGGSLLVLADLTHLKMTVYVPEDRYSRITLGAPATVTVDSWPGQTFTASVERIADRAEYTPRNVQTVAGRKTTVFAVTLRIDNPEGKLKPGTPADVQFGQ